MGVLTFAKKTRRRKFCLGPPPGGGYSGVSGGGGDYSGLGGVGGRWLQRVWGACCGGLVSCLFCVGEFVGIFSKSESLSSSVLPQNVLS